MFIFIFVFWIYNFLATPFRIIPQDFQWILALLTPFPKILSIKLVLKICSKACGLITHSASVTVVQVVQLQHALFLVLTMGFSATMETSYVILFLEFILNVYEALKIIFKLKYKGYSMEDGRFSSRSNTKY